MGCSGALFDATLKLVADSLTFAVMDVQLAELCKIHVYSPGRLGYFVAQETEMKNVQRALGFFSGYHFAYRKYSEYSQSFLQFLKVSLSSVSGGRVLL